MYVQHLPKTFCPPTISFNVQVDMGGSRENGQNFILYGAVGCLWMSLLVSRHLLLKNYHYYLWFIFNFSSRLPIIFTLLSCYLARTFESLTCIWFGYLKSRVKNFKTICTGKWIKLREEKHRKLGKILPIVIYSIFRQEDTVRYAFWLRNCPLNKRACKITKLRTEDFWQSFNF